MCARAPGWSPCSAKGALTYERAFSWLLPGLYRAIARNLAADLADDRPAGSRLRVLDVGAGPGGLLAELAAALPAAELIAIDIDPEMVALARKRMRKADLHDRTQVLVGDVAALPLPDAGLDVVTSSFSVHHWPDARAGFAEIARVLHPGGHGVVYDVPDWWARLETRAPALLDVARAGGFPGAVATPVRWPGRVGFVTRVDLYR